MNRDWLWDQKISLRGARKTLKDPNHPSFLRLASMLLLRKNNPREIFKEFLSPVIFCQNWPKIKQLMKKDAWGKPRLYFWQAVYEKTKERLKARKVILRSTVLSGVDKFCKNVGEKIKNLREKKGLTQEDLAKKLRISQQIISRVESGRQNVSLLTLKNIASCLGAETRIEFDSL